MTDRTIVLDPANPIPFRVFDNGDGTFSLAIHDPSGGGGAARTLDVEVSNGQGSDISRGAAVIFWDFPDGSGVPQIILPGSTGPEFGVPFGILLGDLSTSGTATCRVMGIVDGLDTSGYSPGDDLYLDAGGAFSTSYLTGAWVANVLTSDASNGKVYVGGQVGSVGSARLHGHIEGPQSGGSFSSPVWTEVGTGSVATPSVGGKQAIFIDDTSHHVSRKDSSGAVVDIEARSGIQYRDVQLNDAQIKALPTTPVLVLAAPGDGLAIKLHSAWLVCDKTAGYTNLTLTGTNAAGGTPAGLYFTYGSTDDELASNVVILSGLLSASPGRQIADVGQFYSYDATLSDFAIAQYPSDATAYAEALYVLARNAAGAFTGGDPANTLSIRVWYSIVPAVPFGGS